MVDSPLRARVASLASRCRVAALAAAALAAGSAGAAPPQAEGWRQIVPSASVVGVDGQTYAPSCSTLPGKDPGFRFWARGGSAKRTVVYFEGGGACWDNLTCSFPFDSGLPPGAAPAFYSADIPAATDPAGYDGLFRSDVRDNPVHDWNIVYIPYCTGDIHTGSGERTYANAGNPFLPPTFTVKHHGFDNFMAVLAWMQQNVGRQKQVLVTGSSAGGYGATANFPWIERSYPDARVELLADASQGVTTPAFDTGNPGRNAWNPQLAPFAFGPDPSLVPGGELMRRVAQAYPTRQVAQFTTRLDSVQIGFYGVQKAYYGPGGSCPDPTADWNQQMLAQLVADDAELPNFSYYLADGTYHTILRTPLYYTEATDADPFVRWLGRMLRRPIVVSDVACADCLQPLPCP